MAWEDTRSRLSSTISRSKLNIPVLNTPHLIPLQILYSGHGVEGAAGTLGEEQEQANAHFSPLGLRTKRMDDGSNMPYFSQAIKLPNAYTCVARRDTISSHISYYNRAKNLNMDVMLHNRMLAVLESFLLSIIVFF